MRHDLDERHQGRGEPIHLPLAALACAALAAAAGCGGGGGGETAHRSLLIASGRDDHGVLVQSSVALSAEPEGAAVADVPAGSLVVVLGSRGEWIRVRSLDGTAAGWVNDYHLRGVAHLVGVRPGCPVRTREGGAFAPNAQVELLAYERRGGTTWIRVRAVDGGREAWVRRRAVSELPARPAGPARACSVPEARRPPGRP